MDKETFYWDMDENDEEKERESQVCGDVPETVYGEAEPREDVTLIEDTEGQLMFRLDDVPEYNPANALNVQKANIVINRVGKTTIYSEKVFNNMLSRIQKRKHEDYLYTPEELVYDDIYRKTQIDFSDGYVVEISGSEIKRLLNVKSSKFQEDMDKLMNGDEFMRQWNIIYRKSDHDYDEGSKAYVVLGSYYKKDRRTGRYRLLIKLNPDIARVLTGEVVREYTILDNNIMNRFRYIESYSTYQWLKSELCRREGRLRKKGLPVQDEYTIEISLEEFYFKTMLMTVDVDAKEGGMKKAVELVSKNDYKNAIPILEQMEQNVPTPKRIMERVMPRISMEINGFYDSSVKSICSTPAFAEGCSDHYVTDINFRYVPSGREGYGGKITSLIFFFGWHEKMSDCRPDAWRKGIYEEIGNIIGEDLADGQIKEIAIAADYDIGKVKAAYDVIESKKEDGTFGSIGDLTGYMISLIRKGVGGRTSRRKRPGPVEPAGACSTPAGGSTKKEEVVKDVSLISETDMLFKESRLSAGEIMAILDEAGWDMGKVRKAYAVAMEAPRENLVGFVRRAIRDGYEPSRKYSGPEGGRKDHGFDERTYGKDDFEALERRKLLEVAGAPRQPDYSRKQWNRMMNHEYTHEDNLEIERRKLGVEKKDDTR